MFIDVHTFHDYINTFMDLYGTVRSSKTHSIREQESQVFLH